MGTKAISLQAATPQDMETMTMGYIARGFTIMNKTPAQVTLFKKKQFSMTWLIIDLVLIFLFGFGLLLLIIYLIIYATGSDQMVTITVASLAQPPNGAQVPPQTYSGQLTQQPPNNQVPQQSTSDQFSNPVDAQQMANAPRSPDGNYWWDGQTWKPVSQVGQPDVLEKPSHESN